MSHYALVSRSEPLVLDNEEEEKKVAEHQGSNYYYRDELTKLYETYATLHPNPRLAEEYRERDKLLEVAVASRKRKMDATQSQQGRSRGFFGFWRRKEETTSLPDPTLSPDNLLVYSDIEDDDEDHDMSLSLLCGTQRQLDRRCIPQEAYTAARFHLASVKTQRDRPIVVRSVSDGDDPSSQIILIITGIGQVAEFVNNNGTLEDEEEENFPDEEQSLVPVVKHTSDREDLVSYISSLEGSPFELSYVRAISLGPNFLAVSWGLLDGVLVMYRRVDIPDKEDVGWESVAMFGPTSGVLDTLRQKSADDARRSDSAYGQISSSLLQVTDIVALMVESPYSEDGALPKPPAATLAVSRLGGFVDLLPLTPRLWYGPVLTPKNYKHSKAQRHTRKRKRRHNEPVEHYCLGKLQNLADGYGIVTVSTLEHHSDLLCLDVHRTQVGSDTEWDEEEYPDSPPAEYVLASSGTNEGRETVTFWGVSTVFEEDVAQHPTGFSLIATFIDKIDLGPVGPDICIFASDAIRARWRKPRRVRLRPAHAEDQMNEEDTCSGPVLATSSTEDSNLNRQLTTLTTPAPITCLRFGYDVPGVEALNHSTRTQPELVLAALDWNGGVTVIDCGKAIRVASHSAVGEDGQAHGRQDDHEEPYALSRVWLPRSRFMEWASNVNDAVGIRWWRQTRALDSTRKHDAMYLAMIVRSGKLRLVDLQATDSSDSTIACTVNLASTKQGNVTASIVDSSEEETLTFILDRRCINAREWNGSTAASDRTLSVCAMERMDAALIIQSLAESGQYKKAIDAVKSLNVTEREGLAAVIDLCHKRLWEQGRSVEHLTEVTDDVYVVKQALALYRKNNRSADVSLQTVREASVVALKRARSALMSPELSTVIQRNYRGASVRGNLTSEEEQDSVKLMETAPTKLTASLTGLCTYLLLCNQYGTPATVARFHDKFLSLPVSQLAFSFAKKGDVAALTLLFLRHRNEIVQHRLEVLDQMPTAVSPTSYCHLLPVYRAEGNGVEFFMSRDDEKGHLHWSQMASYLHKSTGSVFFVDSDDEEIVLSSAQQTKGEMTLGGEDERNYLATWYTKRALHIQSAIGSLPLVIEFCDCGLKRLGLPLLSSSGSEATVEDRTVSAPLQQLYALRTCAHHLSQMLNDGILFPSSLQLPFSSSLTMSTEELRTMSLSDLLTMILGEAADSFEVLSKYRGFVQPLVAIPGFTTSLSDMQEDRCEVASEMDNAIASFCLQLIRKAAASSTSPDDTVDSGSIAVTALRDALAVCAAIASASRTTIRKSDRIIKEKAVLIQMVLSVVYDTAIYLERRALSYPECRFLIDFMWAMYECLPKHVPRVEASDEDIRSLQKKVDELNCHLIGADLLSQWTASHVFSFLGEMQKEAGKRGRDGLSSVEEKEIVETSVAPPVPLNVGLNIVSAMCRGFCQQLRRATHSVETQMQFELLQDLFSDVDQLNKWCFHGSLPFGPTVQSQLFRYLLEEEHFELVGALLSDTDSNWIDKVELQNSVLAYVNESMFKEDDSATIDGGRIQSAILCQDTLGPLLPEIQVDFYNMRRYLDAAAFLDNEFGFGQTKPGLHPRDIRDKPPLDVVELVMADYPRSIILGCPEWEDEVFGETANADICQYYRSSSEARLSPQDASPSSSKLPPLPGGAILQLASILGMESASAQLILKSRITHHAVSVGLFAASAAVCMSLVCDPSFPWESEPDANIRLTAVAEVVSTEGYDDIHMKKRLCAAVLQRYRGPLLACDSGPFDVVMRSFALLETETSRFQHGMEDQDGSPDHMLQHAVEENHSMSASEDKEADHPVSRRSGFLVFRAAGMFAKTARRIARSPRSSRERSSLENSRLPPDLRVGHVRPIDRPYGDILIHYATDVHELFSMLQQHLLGDPSQEHDTIDSVMNTLGRLLLFWCISDSLQIHEADIHGSAEQLEARMVLAVGTSLLLHLEDKHSGLSLVKELQSTLETETSNAFENLAAREPSRIVVPEANIVTRLLGRGYSVNGARRSAVMTNNESYESAMAWAVSHSLDRNFDDPIVLLKPQDTATGPGFVDQANIHRIKETLRSIYQFLEGKQNVDSLLSARKEMISTNRLERHVASHCGKRAQNGASLDLATGMTQASPKMNNSFGPTKAGVHPKPTPAIRSNDQAQVSSQMQKSSASGSIASRSTIIAQRTDRSILRPQGEGLRKPTKSDSTQPGNEPRTRSVTEGRSLLKSSRVRPPAKESRYGLGSKAKPTRTATKLERDPKEKDGWDFDEGF